MRFFQTVFFFFENICLTRFLFNELRVTPSTHSDSPPSTWSRHQWSIFLADGPTKNRVIGAFPFSPIPHVRTHTITLSDILTTMPPSGMWQWVGPDSIPPPGGLRSMLSHHRAQAYRSNRDSLRAPPIWLASHQMTGTSSLAWRKQGGRPALHGPPSECIRHLPSFLVIGPCAL